MPGIRHFSQKNFTKCRFAARNRTRDPDDLSRLCTYRQSVKNLLSARICAARLIQLQADRPGCFSSVSSGGSVSSGRILFHETFAFCTELNSFAAFEDLTASFP